jgi:hypothetical protein
MPGDTKPRGYGLLIRVQRALAVQVDAALKRLLLFGKNGAPEEIRTPNLLIRSQKVFFFARFRMVAQGGKMLRVLNN